MSLKRIPIKGSGYSTGNIREGCEGATAQRTYRTGTILNAIMIESDVYLVYLLYWIYLNLFVVVVVSVQKGANGTRFHRRSIICR